MKYRKKTALYICILALSVGVYMAAAYSVYTVRSTFVPVVVPRAADEMTTKTKRAQAKIEELFIVQDDAAKIFSLLDASVHANGVSSTVESVSNLQSVSKNKLSPVSYIDIRVALSGAWEANMNVMHDLEILPVLSRITDVEVLEDKDAQQPKVSLTIRFFVRAI